MKIPLNSFNGGEVTPLLEGRTDLPSLSRSCRLLRNFIPTSAGAAMRRPSLLHQNYWPEATDGLGAVKLIPFTYDTSTRYIVAIWEDWIRVFRSDGTIAWEGVFGLPSSDYWPTIGEFDVNAISYAQVNDILFLAHSAFPPLALQRQSDTTWAQTSVALPEGLGRNYWPAVLDESLTSFEDGDAVEGYTITRSSIGATQNFTLGNMPAEVAGSITYHGPCPAFWRLYMGTTAFTGSITIQACDTWNGTYRTLYTVSGITITNGQAMTLLKEWFHGHAYMKISITYATGSGTLELRHVGSLKAPTVWFAYSGPGSTAAEYRKLYSSPAAFSDWSIGEHVQVAHQRIKQQVEITVAATTADEFKTSSALYVLGQWELFSVGSWQGDVFVEVKESTGNWRTIRHLTSNKDQNYSIGGTSGGETMRLRVSKYDASATSSAAVPRFVLTAVDGVSTQWLTVVTEDTAYNGASYIQIAGMDGFDYTLASQATTSVYRGAFSPSQGYPSSVCIHDQRVYFGGTEKRPTTIWASSVNDLFNFRRTGFDDGGFMFEIASNEGNPIQWMVPASRGILLGTAGDEWLLDGADTGITPTNISARRQSRIGSAPLQAIPAAGSTIFVQRGSMHLQEYQFAWETQQFQAVDLTELIKHLTTSGIRAMAFSQNPEPMLWCVMLDGSLLTCTYNRAQEVIAWAKHTTQGTFESVAVTYGDTANADDVWFVVLRNGTRRLEKIDVAFWANLYNGGRLYHMDGAVTKTGAAFTSVTGLTHLNGLTAKVTANGIAQTDAVVSGGSVTVPTGTTHAVVGLPFTSELQPMPFDIQLQTGTTQSRKMHTPALAVRLYRTDAAKYADSAAGTLYPLKISAGTTGLVRLSNVGRMNDSCEVYFRSTGALPLNLVTVVPSVNVYGD